MCARRRRTTAKCSRPRPGLITRQDVDDALARLEGILRPRVGRRATALVLKNLVSMRELHVDETTILGSIHAAFDAYARIPESGTPFPLGIAKAIADLGCQKLPFLNQRMHPTGMHALGMLDVEARAIAEHADALLPAYGEDDAEFAIRVAWKNAHHFRENLVVGRSYNRNDPAPSAILFEAWQAQGAKGIPIGCVPVDFEQPGIIYAAGPEPGPNVLERTRAFGFLFSPDRGDPISLDDVQGLQRFLAKVPLEITPRTLAWLVHLVRFAFRGKLVEVEDRLNVVWEPLEEEEPARAASMLLGIPPARPEERDRVRFSVDGVTLTYSKGELSS